MWCILFHGNILFSVPQIIKAEKNRLQHFEYDNHSRISDSEIVLQLSKFAVRFYAKQSKHRKSTVTFLFLLWFAFHTTVVIYLACFSIIIIVIFASEDLSIKFTLYSSLLRCGSLDGRKGIRPVKS